LDLSSATICKKNLLCPSEGLQSIAIGALVRLSDNTDPQAAADGRQAEFWQKRGRKAAENFYG